MPRYRRIRRRRRRGWWGFLVAAGVAALALAALGLGESARSRAARTSSPSAAAPPPLQRSHPRSTARAPSPTPTPTPTPMPASGSPAATAQPLPAQALIQVPGKDQYPQLPNGCEVTSLAMLLTAVGHPISKMTLAKEMPVDPTPLKLDIEQEPNGDVIHHVEYWGNPNVGFVGNIYQANYGYGIYHGPLLKLLDQVLPGRGVDLTGQPFRNVLRQVAAGVPVVVWTTTTFRPTHQWVTWQSPEGPVNATPLEHAVLLVGYSPGYVYVNNPIDGQVAQKVAEAPFVAAWHQLGSQAITVTPAAP